MYPESAWSRRHGTGHASLVLRPFNVSIQDHPGLAPTAPDTTGPAGTSEPGDPDLRTADLREPHAYGWDHTGNPSR